MAFGLPLPPLPFPLPLAAGRLSFVAGRFLKFSTSLETSEECSPRSSFSPAWDARLKAFWAYPRKHENQIGHI